MTKKNFVLVWPTECRVDDDLINSWIVFFRLSKISLFYILIYGFVIANNVCGIEI